MVFCVLQRLLINGEKINHLIEVFSTREKAEQFINAYFGNDQKDIFIEVHIPDIIQEG